MNSWKRVSPCPHSWLIKPKQWLQPGSFDDDILQFAFKEFRAALAGMDGGTRGEEGWCVLVDGEKALKGAKRDKKL